MMSRYDYADLVNFWNFFLNQSVFRIAILLELKF